MKIMLVAESRPKYMKIAPLIGAIRRYNQSGAKPFEPVIVYSGPRSDQGVSELFLFDEVGLPRPDIHLELGHWSHGDEMGKDMILIEELLHSLMPELVLVAGDEHASLAFTLGAKKLKIPVARLEGGLRSGETGLPEETNRKLIDYVSDYLFTTDLNANANLLREGISEERLYFVGNILVETLYGHLSKAAFSQVLNHLDLREGLEIRPFGVVSLRRPSNVDHFQTFREICDALSQISKGLPLIFPCHPRTQQRIRSYGLENLFGKSLLHEDRIIIIDPLSHLDFLHLKAHSKIILTDSDGIQEEATILGIPCLTLRETTERPVTISQGTNRLVGSRKEDILKGYALAMEDYKEPHMKPERWDGRTSENVVRILAQISEKGRSRYREESEMVAWNRR